MTTETSAKTAGVMDCRGHWLVPQRFTGRSAWGLETSQQTGSRSSAVLAERTLPWVRDGECVNTVRIPENILYEAETGRGGEETGGKEPFQLRGRRAPLKKCHFSRDLHGEPQSIGTGRGSSQMRKLREDHEEVPIWSTWLRIWASDSPGCSL